MVPRMAEKRAMRHTIEIDPDTHRILRRLARNGQTMKTIVADAVCRERNRRNIEARIVKEYGEVLP